jgi:hypothetical protein
LGPHIRFPQEKVENQISKNLHQKSPPQKKATPGLVRACIRRREISAPCAAKSYLCLLTAWRRQSLDRCFFEMPGAR